MSKAAIILAAGAGTRMKSALPKVLHKVAGLPLLGHVIAALRGAGVERIVVVTSPAGEAVRDYAAGAGLPTAPCRTSSWAPAMPRRRRKRRWRISTARWWSPMATCRWSPADTIAECLKAQARTGLALLAFRAARSRRLWPGAADAGRLSEPHRGISRTRARPSAPSPCAMPAAMPPMREKFFRWAASAEQ